MLKKTIRRLGALAMVLAMAVSVFAVNASAADATKLSSDANEATTYACVRACKCVEGGHDTQKT